MSHPQLPTIARIAELYDSLRAQKVLLYKVKTARKIGLLLETILGKSLSMKRVEYETRYRDVQSDVFIAQLPLSFDQAKSARSLYINAPESLGFNAAAEFAGEIAILCGARERKRIQVTQRAASPAVVVYNALEQARVAVEKQAAYFADLHEDMRVNMAGTIVLHAAWANELIAKLGLNEIMARDKDDRIFDGALGRFVDSEIGKLP